MDVRTGRTSLVPQMVKRLSTMRETRVQSLGWEDPLEKEMAIHSRTIAWKIPRTEEPGGLQSTGSQGVGHDWATSLCSAFTFRLYSPWNSPGQNAGVGSLSLLQGIVPTQGSNLGLPHCRQILYHLSHKESPRILEWVTYPFSRGSSWARSWTRVSCIAGGFFTNWAIGKPLLHKSNVNKILKTKLSNGTLNCYLKFQNFLFGFISKLKSYK